MSRMSPLPVLIVDDNDATSTLMKAILARDYRVEVANDGGEAIEMIERQPYAAILLDLKMPGRSGFEVLEHIRSNMTEMLPRVLVVTAALSESDIKRASGFGVCGIVRKPFEVDHLLQQVHLCAAATGGDQSHFDAFAAPAMMMLLDLIQRRFLG